MSWDVSDLEDAFRLAGLSLEWETVDSSMQWFVSPAVLDRWFQEREGQSYGDRLRQVLSERQVDTIQQILRSQLLNQTIIWKSYQVFLKIRICQ